MPASALRDNGARYKRCFNNPSLEVRGELPPPPSPTDNFQTMDRRQLRLKLMVKRRHKPISHSEIATIADHASQKKVGSKQRLPSNALIILFSDFVPVPARLRASASTRREFRFNIALGWLSKLNLRGASHCRR